MKLTRKHLSLLAMLFLRAHMGDYAWGRTWEDGLRRKGRVDGNLKHGRTRTLHALNNLGLVAGPNLTEAGQKALFSAPRFEASVYLDDVARDTLKRVWPQEVPSEV